MCAFACAFACVCARANICSMAMPNIMLWGYFHMYIFDILGVGIGFLDGSRVETSLGRLF
jgi:ABC-type multidrug transport system permease subunit